MEKSPNNFSEFSLPERYHSDRRGPKRWIFSHAVRQWPFILLAILGAVLNAVLASVAPVWIGQAFDLILSKPAVLDGLVRLAILIGVSQVLRALVMFVRNFGFEFIAQKIERNIREELYVNLLGKSMTFHSLQSVGETMARATNDVREVNYMFSPGFNLVIGSLVFLIMPVLVAPRYHFSLVLTPVIFILLYIISLRRYLRTLSPVTDQVRSTFGDLNSRLTESLDGIETVKAASQECSEIRRFGMNVNQYRDAVVKQGEIEAKFLPYLLLSLAMAFGLLHALLLSRMGIIDIGDVVAYFGLILLLDFPTFTSLFAYSQISVGVSSAKRILELLNREDNLDQNLEGLQEKVKGEVEFRNVSFSYPGNDHTLEKINFKVEPGQTVAIVGQTGSGKTTLVKLINRIFDVTDGQVLVDGVDVRDWNMENLRRQISIIEQDIFLFSKTISDNIAFGKPDAEMADIVQVAQDAQAHDFIKNFKEGYQTVLGERGVTISGGQRQRLALARAFLTDPRILILDDSTSAIDSATEDRIQQAIYKAALGRTTFIITHRLSQIRWADLIIVMRKGKIAAIGNHEELLETSEAYRRIFSE